MKDLPRIKTLITELMYMLQQTRGLSLSQRKDFHAELKYWLAQLSNIEQEIL